MRVATIDIGTNSVLLLVAEAGGGGGGAPALRALEERATITRLGQGVDRTRALAPEAVHRTLACLSDYAVSIRRHGVQRVAVVATSAARDAGGAAQFVSSAEAILGVAPRVISGDEEARLTFSGALVGLEVGGAVSVFDVGGGSLEMVHGVADAHGARVVAARSLDVGSVRLTERCLRSDPPARDELAQVCEHARDALRDVPAPPAAATWVGIAGTVTTLASVSLGMASYDGARVHGSALRRTDVAQLLERLAAMPLAARREVKGLEPKRADVIVAGACIVREVLDWAQAAQMLVSDRGVRWGLALELARAR